MSAIALPNVSPFSLASPGVMVIIALVALPFLAGFSSYLVTQAARYLALAISLVSLAWGLPQIFSQPLPVQLLDNFGVTLLIDSLSGYYIVTNALVTAAVLIYCWRTDKSAFFYTQVMILHGSLNGAFICADFISLYVALEVIGIAAFLLIAYPRTNRAIWVALRYLFVSNTAMLFYLIGALLVYKASGSFAFAGLGSAPPEAIAFIFLGLLTKGGVLVSGLWLPLTHAESETPVSALLSGVVVKAGIFPLVRCALLVEEVAPIVSGLGAAAALFGVVYAIAETDSKRTLAFSTLSQLGFVLAAPVAAGGYALTHGLAKAALFLTAGNLPSRSFAQLRETPMTRPRWLALLVAGLSVSGMPLLAGFGAKALTVKAAGPWQGIVLNLAAVGTAIALAKFIFLPHSNGQPDGTKPAWAWTGWSPALLLLTGGLVLANGFFLETYTLANAGKAIAVVAGGWLIYWLARSVISRQQPALPKAAERLEHLIGVMSLMLTLLFWMVLT